MPGARPADGAGEFNLPWGICTDQQDNVYVLTGAMTASRSSPATAVHLDDRLVRLGLGQLHPPANVAVDDTGNVYVADWGNERVSVFTRPWLPPHDAHRRRDDVQVGRRVPGSPIRS
jgi:DNA-binding beta-propeller fold protein YncE